MQGIISVFFGLLLIVLPLTYEWMDGIMSRQTIPLYVSTVVCLLIVLLLFRHAKKRLLVELSLSDLLIAGYLLYGFLNVAIVKNFEIDSLVFYKWTAMGLGYVLVRMLGNGGTIETTRVGGNGRIVMFGLLTSGLVQSVVIFLQAGYLLESNHRMFEVTGTFGNPGQLGGFLAIILVVAIGLGLTYWNEKRWTSVACWGSAVAILTALIISDSRAGWIAGLISLGYLLFLFGSQYLKPIFAYKSGRSLSIIVCCILMGLIIAGLYRYRPKSADGRLLTWRVSGGMIVDKPVSGHGIGSFPEQYMLRQVDYFEQHSDSPYAMVAGNITYPFNEYIYLGVEQGIVGLLLLLGVLSILFFSKSRNPIQRVYKAGLLAWCVFAFFSYPSHVFPLLFLFAVFAGLIKTGTIVLWRLHPVWRWAFVSIGIGVIGLSVNQIRFYRETDRHIPMLRGKTEDERVQGNVFIKNNYEKLRSNRIFMNVYSQLVYQYQVPEERLSILENAARIAPSCELFCDLGDTYQILGKYDKAERVFTMASYMLPSRITPDYSLFNLYRETGNISAARTLADKIVSKPVKIVSTATIYESRS